MCVFKNDFDLINDVLFQYSIFVKNRKKDILPENDAFCSFCGYEEIIYPNFAYFGHKPEYCFNSSDKTKFYRFRICKKCHFFANLAESKLKELSKFNKNILVIPNRKEGDYWDFIRNMNQNSSSFKKLNTILKDSTNFNYDLILYNQNKVVMNINKYIENYRSFLIAFEDLFLFKNGELNYVYGVKDLKQNIKIKSIFDIENLFKDFFIYVQNDKIFSLNNDSFYFYQIYTKILTGKKGLLHKFDSVSKSLFLKYMYNIFDLVYEINFDALNRDMINELTFNALKILQKNNKRNKNGFFIFRLDILKRINSYLFIRNEILEENMFNKKNVENVVYYLNNLNDESNEEKLFKCISEDISIKYYLIGQFIRYIDNFKLQNNKNTNVFSNFVAHVHRNNIKTLFVNEILLKNQFYINQMSNKGKFLFKIFESDLDSLFREEGLNFEDYIILMFTGYYVTNVLSKGGNQND